MKCVRDTEDAGALCRMNGRFSDVEFDGKCRVIQGVEFRDIVGVRMAVAIEMNWRLSNLARITQCRMVWNGSASMST